MKNRPNLSLRAASPDDLLRQLAAIDITVPLVTAGRTKEHREQHMMARLLATVANTSLLRFPIQVTHTERPDFVLRMRNEEVGVECVEANHPENYHIECIRESEYPEAMNFGQRFEPGKLTHTKTQKHEIASGQTAGPPWMPDSMRTNWIAAMEFTVADKLDKLRAGNYIAQRPAWLLIHDEWPNPIRFYPEAIRLAATELHLMLAPHFVPPTFTEILLASGYQLFKLDRNTHEVLSIPRLWNVA